MATNKSVVAEIEETAEKIIETVTLVTVFYGKISACGRYCLKNDNKEITVLNTGLSKLSCIPYLIRTLLRDRPATNQDTMEDLFDIRANGELLCLSSLYCHIIYDPLSILNIFYICS